MKILPILLFSMLITAAVAEKKTYQYRMELSTMRNGAFAKAKELGLLKPEREASYEAAQLKARNAARELSKFKKENPKIVKLGEQAQSIERNYKLSELAGDEAMMKRYTVNRGVFYEQNAASAEKIRAYLSMIPKADSILDAQIDSFIKVLHTDPKGKAYVEKIHVLEKTIQEREVEEAKKFCAKWK